MATASISKGVAKVAINNTPQANADRVSVDENGHSTVDVLANDLGGAAKQFWSFNQGNLAAQTGIGDCLHLDGLKVTFTGGGLLDVQVVGTGFDHLAAGQTQDVSFSYSIRMANGAIATSTVTITVVGSNDAAEITGAVAGCVTEDTSPGAAGTLAVADKDDGQSGFQAQADMDGAYGSFHFDAATGGWSYALGEAAQALHSGEAHVETFTVKSLDGTAQDVTVTVHGTDDAAVFAGSFGGEVTEDESPFIGGFVTVSDKDAGDTGFGGDVDADGAFGSFHFNAATGEWSYALGEAAQALHSGETKMEVFTISAFDGTQQDITIAVHGQDEAPPPPPVPVVALDLTYDPGQAASDLTMATFAGQPGSSGGPDLNGKWNSWLSGLSAWRADLTGHHGSDLDPSSTTVAYTYAQGGQQNTVSNVFDKTFSYYATPAEPAELSLDAGTVLVQYSNDLVLQFAVTGAAGDLALLTANTSVSVTDLDGDSLADDTLIAFNGGGSLGLLNGTFTSINDLGANIVFA